MNELDAGLYTTLTGATAITDLLANGTASVFAWLAPENEDPPYVVFNQQADTPVYRLPAVAYENLLYQVRAVTEGESAKLAGQIEDAVEAALTDQAVSVSGHTLMYLRKESGVDYVEVTQGQRYHHRGAIYRVMVAPT